MPATHPVSLQIAVEMQVQGVTWDTAGNSRPGLHRLNSLIGGRLDDVCPGGLIEENCILISLTSYVRVLPESCPCSMTHLLGQHVSGIAKIHDHASAQRHVLLHWDPCMSMPESSSVERCKNGKFQAGRIGRGRLQFAKTLVKLALSVEHNSRMHARLLLLAVLLAAADVAPHEHGTTKYTCCGGVWGGDGIYSVGHQAAGSVDGIVQWKFALYQLVMLSCGFDCMQCCQDCQWFRSYP